MHIFKIATFKCYEHLFLNWTLPEIKLKLLVESIFLSFLKFYPVLGDSGYPLEMWLMTPILHPTSRSENNYNSTHVKTRNVIERLNGVLKSRFRCLSQHRTLNMSPTVAFKIMNACSILHNSCVCGTMYHLMISSMKMLTLILT